MLDNVYLPLLQLGSIFLGLEFDHDEVFLGLDPLIKAYLDQVVSQLYLESWKGIVVVTEGHLPLKVFTAFFNSYTA